jgi:CyaY protein
MVNDALLDLDGVINKIADLIDAGDPSGKFDIDMNNNVLSIKTDDGVYILNKQPALAEIWLSSPVSGPYHFALRGGEWLASSGEKLYYILESELGIEINIA